MLIPSRLFLEGGEGEIGYRNIRDGQSASLVRARYHCEYLWTFFQHHCDRDFQKELRTNFHSRYWEMFLTVSLILGGYSVTCPKPIGPDVGIIHRGRRIWFEATTPTPGSILSPDKVDAPDMQTTDGQAAIFDTPNDKIVLRYLNSIKHKYQCQYQNWLKKGIVSQNDAFVIALNPRAIRLDNADTRPARILQAAYPIGNETLTLNKETGKIVGRGVELRPYIEKAAKPGAEPGDEKTKVETGVFATDKYAGLSALLVSRVDAVNNRGELFDDFQLAPNPHASAPLPPSFRLGGTYYRTEIAKGGGYDVTAETV